MSRSSLIINESPSSEYSQIYHFSTLRPSALTALDVLSPAYVQNLKLSPFSKDLSCDSFLSLNVGIVCKFF